MIEIKSKNEIYIDQRKLDSRWALIQENDVDLIFVDENEIIYPKRINAEKGASMQNGKFLESFFFQFFWRILPAKVWESKIEPLYTVTQVEDFIGLLALSCGQYAQVSHQIDALISLVESSGQSIVLKYQKNIDVHTLKCSI